MLLASLAIAVEAHYLFIVVVSITMEVAEMVAEYNSGNGIFVIFGDEEDLSSSSSSGV